MDYVFILIIGLVIGSFLNVCIFRIPREESIAFPPSHCMKCGYKLKWYDLIPVFSYIFLKGRCRKCNDKISIQYPIIEIANGLIYILIYLTYGISLDTLKFMFLSSLMIVISIIDLKTKFVYTSTIICGIVGAVIFLGIDWYFTSEFPIYNLAGGFLSFIFIWLIVVITKGMGEGDAEIALVSGLFLGVKNSVFMLLTSIIFGGIVAGVILIFKIKDRKSEIAFGPYLGIGTVLSLLIGNYLINIYMQSLIF